PGRRGAGALGDRRRPRPDLRAPVAPCGRGDPFAGGPRHDPRRPRGDVPGHREAIRLVNIGDLYYTLRGDGSQLVIDAQQSGAAAAQAFGLKFQTVANAGKIVAGAALAIATVQGAQLNQVLNDLQSETGATGEDWAAMQG